jgi:Holliday junction DNA helicase RuvA
LIASLKGVILSKKPEGVVIEVGGVGYHVCVPLCSLGDIPEPGNTIFLYTYTHVREDELKLFGFLSEEERKVFITLIGINGIGPKLALTILSGMSVSRFIEAIHNEDVSLLATIPGLGKKTAARLVLELKGRLPSIATKGTYSVKETSETDDAISALVNLGYKKSLSEKAIERAIKNGATTIEDMIKEALKYLTESKKV